MLKAVGRWTRDRLARPFRGSADHNREVIGKMLMPFSGTFLELGPGNAPLLRDVEWIPQNQKLVLEFPDGIERSKALGYRCLAQDLGKETWDLPDESVDVVLSTQVLEHIPNTDHVIHQAYRVLKPGGKVLFSVPNPGALAYIVMLLLTVNPPMNQISDEYRGLGNPFSNTGNTRVTFPAI